MATHILVVDDETAIADLVEVYLKNEGFTSSTARFKRVVRTQARASEAL